MRISTFLRGLVVPLIPGLGGFPSVSSASEAAPPPNVVIVFADDMGFGDAGCYGHPQIKTPNLDRMAREGTRFTRFYVPQPVCSASRAGLLTGCYPNRIGIHGALGPNANHGLNADELTIAEMLKPLGYATGMSGKWHLGHRPEFLPTRHGFDEWLGLPYSNDMWPLHPAYADLPAGSAKRKEGYPDLPLYEDERIIDAEVTAKDQAQLTARYTERAVSFIERNKDRPFFFYLAHSMPHVPLFVSDKFKGKSRAGLYADVIGEIDWSVGQVLDALERAGVADRTWVIFTSDNGPWLSYGNHAGSAGSLREGKGTCWEGGVREPCIMRWPGRIPVGRVCDEPLMTIDLLPTLAGVAGATLPAHAIDGLDVWPIVAGQPGANNPHDAYYFYYRRNELQAVMSGRWKLQLPHTYRTLAGRPGGRDGHPVPYESREITENELYDLENDIGEIHDVGDENPAVVSRLSRLADRARVDLGDALTQRDGSGTRQPGRAD
jgi:arylsulfatase